MPVNTFSDLDSRNLSTVYCDCVVGSTYLHLRVLPLLVIRQSIETQHLDQLQAVSYYVNTEDSDINIAQNHPRCLARYFNVQCCEWGMFFKFIGLIIRKFNLVDNLRQIQIPYCSADAGRTGILSMHVIKCNKTNCCRRRR